MKNILLIAWFMSLCFLSACAQTRTGIQKTYAFFKESFPGNIPVDDNGNPLKGMDTLRFIYIECSGNSEPIIETVQYKNKMYTAAVHAVAEKTVIAGRKKGSNKNVVIKPGKGNRLWRVELTPSGEQRSSQTNKIVLKGKKDGRSFTLTIAKEIELEADIRG